MARFFLLLLLLIFAVSLEAISNSEILKRADSFMVSGDQSNQIRAYDDYKNLYLRAITENDSNLKLQSLKGIVKSGTVLNIDVSKYSKELQGLSSSANSYHPPEPKPMKETKNIKNMHVDPLHKLESVRWDENRLFLTFDREINDRQVTYLTNHDKAKKRYRYIFDIKTSMLIKAQNINKAQIDMIKLSQYDPESLRLVIENGSDIKISHNIDSRTLEINFQLEPQKIPEVITNIQPSKKGKERVIVIDAGHGGEDPGAIGYKSYKEKSVVFDISKELEKNLKSRGYKVYMTRNSDKFVKLSDRTKFANEKGASIFVSVHANAVANGNANSAHGIECYFLSPSRSDRAKNVAAQENSADMSDMNMYGKDSYLNLLNHHNILASNKLAIDLQRGMLGAVSKKYKNVNDNGVKEGPFWVLVGAQMPSVLVEVGFLSHPEEGTRLASDDYRKLLAKGLAEGIERYFANCK
ncbi:MAG: N-acetylmuramoyl-L-alanine amidase [Sulfurimonas sp.]|uniref:N-acetylmuramoyl-L-alanine amidase family protein n=1 Tax=Sulfurimonas sp. TaxID=2022749 RepID=UPI00260525E1|nr:N-acetylmuramoyl-L-alanine amidase [Sulfurimonas sp.]MDD5372704.1 N-acetylmuramoyl-L-alanine amidase [Sulfurimonas sp.]